MISINEHFEGRIRWANFFNCNLIHGKFFGRKWTQLKKLTIFIRSWSRVGYKAVLGHSKDSTNKRLFPCYLINTYSNMRTPKHANVFLSPKSTKNASVTERLAVVWALCQMPVINECNGGWRSVKELTLNWDSTNIKHKGTYIEVWDRGAKHTPKFNHEHETEWLN